MKSNGAWQIRDTGQQYNYHSMQNSNAIFGIQKFVQLPTQAPGFQAHASFTASARHLAIWHSKTALLKPQAGFWSLNSLQSCQARSSASVCPSRLAPRRHEDLYPSDLQHTGEGMMRGPIRGVCPCGNTNCTEQLQERCTSCSTGRQTFQKPPAQHRANPASWRNTFPVALESPSSE